MRANQRSAFPARHLHALIVFGRPDHLGVAPYALEKHELGALDSRGRHGSTSSARDAGQHTSGLPERLGVPSIAPSSWLCTQPRHSTATVLPVARRRRRNLIIADSHTFSPVTACDAHAPASYPRIDRPRHRMQKIVSQLGTEPWATSCRYTGRHHLGMPGRLRRYPQPEYGCRSFKFVEAIAARTVPAQVRKSFAPYQ
jgi:hypothetical protein